jgi:hypothetical protein
VRALVERAEALASATIKRRVDALADAWREHGVRVTTDAGSVTIEGKRSEALPTGRPLARIQRHRMGDGIAWTE